MYDENGLECYLTYEEAKEHWTTRYGGIRAVYMFGRYYEDPYMPVPPTDIGKLEHKLNESIVRMHNE